MAAKELPLRSASVAMASAIIVLYGGWSIAALCDDILEMVLCDRSGRGRQKPKNCAAHDILKHSFVPA